jgi:predicted transcriptional regulator
MMLIDNKYLARAFKKSRCNAHLSQAELALYLHISKNDIVQYESGKKIIPESLLLQILLMGII